MTNMKHDGYFLIKVRKSVNLYLFSHDKSELEHMMKKGMEIVSYYKNNDGHGYLDIHGQMIRID